MRKRDEMSDPTSCTNRARDGELMFVLLGRDAAAPAAIRAWVQERVRIGKNSMADAQIQDALRCAEMMERERPFTAPKTVAETAVDRVYERRRLPLEST